MWLRVSALVLRYLYLYRRSLARAGEVFFWPVMDLLVWGFVSTYLASLAGARAVTFLIGAMILWDVLYRPRCKPQTNPANKPLLIPRNVMLN